MFTRVNRQARRTTEPQDWSWPVNSWEPVQGDCIARDQLEDENVQVWPVEDASWHRRMAAGVVIVLAAAIGGVLATLFQGRRTGAWGELGRAEGYYQRQRRKKAELESSKHTAAALGGRQVS